MARVCASNVDSDREAIAGFSDNEIRSGVDKHADPSWWELRHVKRSNKAYLRRWGSLLRREARQRGLL